MKDYKEKKFKKDEIRKRKLSRKIYQKPKEI